MKYSGLKRILNNDNNYVIIIRLYTQTVSLLMIKNNYDNVKNNKIGLFQNKNVYIKLLIFIKI